MTSYLPPKKGAAYIFYTCLASQADTKKFQVNPTIAAGDFKVSTDGGAFSNLDALPVVTPAGGVAVKISLSASEMNGDNIVVTCIDAAGAEWCDRSINIQTATQTFDETDAVVDAIKVILDYLVPITGAVDDASATVTYFVSNLPSTANDFYNGMILIFTSGALAGIPRIITDYFGSSKTVEVWPAYTQAPADTDTFVLLNTSPFSYDNVKSAVGSVIIGTPLVPPFVGDSLITHITAIKGVVDAIQLLVDELESGDKPPPKAIFDLQG